MPRQASLYVHAPFCRAKCRYCAFFSAPTGAGGPPADSLALYLGALDAEMDRQAALYGPLQAPSLFFGGGTPSLLGADALSHIMSALRARFTLEEDVEATLEANPDSATPELLHAARALGFNRLSLGVQSLCDADLTALGRAHDVEQALCALRDARAAGFTNIGLDLIFGLPGQSVEGWLATLDRAVGLGPEHLSCYGLTVEPGTPLAEDVAALATLPDEDAQAEMFLRGSELLAAAGYEHYEISNYARPGRRCRHNLACWQGRDVLAFGPAAVSTMALDRTTERWANPADLSAWAELVHTGCADQGWRETLTPDIRARESLMLALRTSDGLNLAAHRTLTGQNLVVEQAVLLDQLVRTGLVKLDANSLKLTQAGMLVSNSVIRALGFDSRQNKGS